ncbi:unnamed protein product, partial [Prorocentrum cordatum]
MGRGRRRRRRQEEEEYHPSALTTEDLRSGQAFQGIMNEAWGAARRRGQAGRQGVPEGVPPPAGRPASGDEPPGPELRKVEEAFANSIMANKIIATVKGIDVAASEANAWTLTGAMPTTFEVAMAESGKMGGTKDKLGFSAVAVHMQDKAYMACAESRRLFKTLLDAAVPLGQSTQFFEPVLLPCELWHSRSFSHHPEFRKHGLSYWSFKSLDDPRALGHPLTLWPWPHANLFFLYYRTEFGAPSVDWSFTTEARLSISEPAAEAGGSGAHELRGRGRRRAGKEAGHAGSPVRPPAHPRGQHPRSGEAAQLAARGDQEHPPLRPGGLRGPAGGRPRRAAVKDTIAAGAAAEPVALQGVEARGGGLQAAGDGDWGAPHTERCGRPDRPGAADAVPLPRAGVRRGPVGGVGGRRSGGRHRPVYRLLGPVWLVWQLRAGWQLHAKLLCSGRRLRLLAGSAELFAALMLSASALFSVLVIHQELQRMLLKEDMLLGYLQHAGGAACQGEACFSSSVAFAIRCGMLACPMAAGVAMTLLSHFQLAQKWGHVNLASHQVVAEIYQFLAGVGQSEDPSMDRKRFLHRLQSIVKDLSLAHSEDDHALSGSSADGFLSDPRELQRH